MEWKIILVLYYTKDILSPGTISSLSQLEPTKEPVLIRILKSSICRCVQSIVINIGRPSVKNAEVY